MTNDAARNWSHLIHFNIWHYGFQIALFHLWNDHAHFGGSPNYFIAYDIEKCTCKLFLTWLAAPLKLARLLFYCQVACSSSCLFLPLSIMVVLYLFTFLMVKMSMIYVDISFIIIYLNLSKYSHVYQVSFSFSYNSIYSDSRINISLDLPDLWGW